MNIKKIIAAFLSFAVLAGGITCNEIYLKNEFAVSAAEESNEQLEDSTTLSIVQVPDKLVYNIGEELDLTGGMAYAKGVYNGENWDTSNQPLDSEYFKIDASEFDNQESGTYSIYVTNTYGVPETRVFAVRVVYTEIEEEPTFYISQAPVKSKYRIGEELDFTGGMVYSLDMGDCELPIDPKYFKIDASEFDNQKVGRYRIYVLDPNVSDMENDMNWDSFSVEVAEGGGNLHLSSPPDKLVYNIGEELDLTGGVARAQGFYNGERWEISEQLLDSEYFDIDASEFNNQKAGVYNIYVTNTYGEPVTESFQVKVIGNENNNDGIDYEERNESSLYIRKEPDKTVYNIGEELDLTGGEAEAAGMYNGAYWDTTSFQPLDSEHFKIDASEFDNQKEGVYTIYVTNTYGEPVTESFEVEVVEVIYGDANVDGVVDIADIAIVKCYLINSEKYSMTSKGLKNADVQGNENGINVNDAIAIQKYVLGMIDSFSE